MLAHFESLFGRPNCVYSEKMKEDVGNVARKCKSMKDGFVKEFFLLIFRLVSGNFVID